jgi:hypothetical protein
LPLLIVSFSICYKIKNGEFCPVIGANRSSTIEVSCLSGTPTVVVSVQEPTVSENITNGGEIVAFQWLKIKNKRDDKNMIIFSFSFSFIHLDLSIYYFIDFWIRLSNLYRK